MKKKNGPVQAGIILLLFALSFLAVPRHARAEERIVSLDVIAELQEDSSLLMTERIRVTIEHNSIKHGIYRVFPLSQVLENNKYRFHNYDFKAITLDGEKVPYTKAARSGHVALAIGTEKEKAPLGEHTYEIRYRVTDHVLFFDDRDEIYLNVTGNDWKLPMDAVSFTFVVPGGSENILETKAFTGSFGKSGSDYVMEGNNTFHSTRPFAVGEGLTVAVAWKKGIVSRPGDFRSGWATKNREACFLLIFGFVALYCFICKRWLKKPLPPVIPLFSPPEGMSPGYVSALMDIEDSGRFFHADMMGAAINGFLRLDAKDAKNFVFHGLKPKKMPEKWIAHYCREVTAFLTSPENPCDLKTIEGKTQVAKTLDFLKSKYKRLLKDSWQDNLFLKIAGWAVVYIIASFMAIAIDIPEVPGESRWMYPISIAIFYFFAGLGLFFFKTVKAKGRHILGKICSFLLGVTLCILGVGMIFAQMESDAFLMSRHLILFFLTAFFMGRIPRKSRTIKAMDAYAQVLGLEMYMRTAEKHRLAMLNAPEDTIKKFEELLPYAVALGCAEAWQKRFDKLLREMDYGLVWIDRKDLAYKNVVHTVIANKAMIVAINACVTANRAQQRSIGGSGLRSGSSDGHSGGSSGGGSGGGGGGGW